MVTHLDPALADKGVWFGDLDRAIADRPELVEPYLHALVPADRSKFTALHAAFRSAGTFLYVPPGVEVELPLQTMTWIDAEDAAVFPRTLLVAGENAEVTLIDRYGSPTLGRALSDAIVEIHAGPGSRVRYVGLQEYGDGVTHLAVQRARIGRGADLKSLGVAFGASLARAEVEALLAEDGGSSEMLGVYFGDGDQHIDHRSIQDHVGSRTSSDLLYKGAMRDTSNAIYTGTVIIEHGAHQCDAYQTNRNILLSDHARAQSVPNLEILTNDPTRCGHAASVGPVSDDELFYLMSRGIPEKEAERLIVFGFFAEVLDRVDIAEIREGLEARDRAGDRAGGPMSLVRICGVHDVPEGEVRRFELDHRPFAVANLGDEGFRVVDAICSHAHYFLDEGEVDVDDQTIECPKHGSTFDLNTGSTRTLPATQPVEVFATKVEHDDVLIEVPEES